MSNCLFCKIAAGEIPAQKVFEDQSTLVFNDITPQAPVHLLVIPKKHVPSVHDITDDTKSISFELFQTVQKVVAQKNLSESGGYRLVINSGKDAGQAVDHLHIHILAGRPMKWPPG